MYHHDHLSPASLASFEYWKNSLADNSQKIPAPAVAYQT